MNLDRFIAEREPDWSELERILASARGRPHRLGAAGVRRLGGLYRAVAADLALVRRRFPTDPARARLEQLVARARVAVYDAEPRRTTLRSFLGHGYWCRVRERPRLLAIAWALLLASAALSALWALKDPGAAVGLVPEAFRGAGDPGGTHTLSGAQSAAFSSEIFTNNIRVTFLAFAAGIVAGLGTALVLVYNGVILGAVAGLAAGAGHGRLLVELVAPHGVLELSCIAVSAAAGLRLGWALVAPGHRRRGDALVEEARSAVEVVLGTIPWLVVAGLVEGFVTPVRLGLGPALAVGLGPGALFWTLVWRLGRARPALPGTPASTEPLRAALAPSP